MAFDYYVLIPTFSWFKSNFFPKKKNKKKAKSFFLFEGIMNEHGILSRSFIRLISYSVSLQYTMGSLRKYFNLLVKNVGKSKKWYKELEFKLLTLDIFSKPFGVFGADVAIPPPGMFISWFCPPITFMRLTLETQKYTTWYISITYT